MNGITGFRLRHQPYRRDDAAVAAALPPPLLERGPRYRVLEKLKDLGGEFRSMSEDEYGAWIEALPCDEFIELMSAVLGWQEKSDYAGL
ncbi:hypothetical protein [Ralstonia pickettii]|uniref:Uncharacterized protein n=1 Tax=Ralstonia pickettii TaxID=329 RepID=A0AAW4Q744_RALPI|nr:hypothetical protein [Ralstonia pickettii]MBX3793651.1 hypothetical protein [Ralstonia pickettii]MBX3876198.1 hypothetical protein [Ralstonia pickettii]MBX3886991.1 hypothetical protein [Ralstonia pickettii]MBX3891326.1 hypothetical protein [Ralstonia pickettii]MBX3945516.1 hypothetical protein [Ralstonia pickettii]